MNDDKSYVGGGEVEKEKPHQKTIISDNSAKLLSDVDIPYED